MFRKTKNIIIILFSFSMIFITIFIYGFSGVLLNFINKPIINEQNLLNVSPKYRNTFLKFEDILLNNNEVIEVATKYSSLFKNVNDRQMYVFSTPVKLQYRDSYLLFDEKIYKDDTSYFTNNRVFNVIYDKNEIIIVNNKDTFSINLKDFISFEKDSTYMNIYGEIKECIKYCDNIGNELYVFSTYNGVHFEYNTNQNINELKFEINEYNYEINELEAGYLHFKIDNVKKFIVYQAQIFCENILYENNKVKIEKDTAKYYIKYDIPSNVEKNAKISFDIDCYSEKMFYDTSVYEEEPSTNTMYNNYSFLYSNNNSASSYTFLKANMQSFVPNNSDVIDSVNFNFFVVYTDATVVIEVFKVNKNWCSWTLDWKTKPKFTEQIGQFTVDETGWYSIDMTEYTKTLINNDFDKFDDNSFVFKIKDSNSGKVIIASCDNTYAPPYFEAKYHIE